MITGRAWSPVLVVALSFLLLLGSFSPGMAQNASRPPEWQKTLIIATTFEPSTFDPAVNVGTAAAWRYYPNVYESLVQYSPDGKIVPMLAEKWQILDNGLRYRFFLVRNAKFGDGATFDASAAKFAFDRFISIGKGLVSSYRAVKTVEVVDQYTIDVVLKELFTPFLGVLATWNGAIFVSPSDVKAHDSSGDQAQAWLHNHTAGTGPYVLSSWEPENRVVLLRNPNYRLGWKPGQVERVVFVLMREPSTIRQALEGGQVDMVEDIVPSLIQPLRNAQNIVLSIKPNYGLYGQTLFLNLNKPPFNDVNVRKALAYAIDYDRLVALWQGTAVRAYGPFPATFRPWYAEKTLVQYRYDLARAREFFAKAGMNVPISPPLRFDVLWLSGVTVHRDMGQLIADDWGKFGIQLNIVEVPVPVWRQAISRNTFDMLFFQTAMRSADPDAIASLIFPSTEFRFGGSNPGYRNPRVDQLIELGRTTLGTTARRTYYAEFQHIVTDEVAIINLVDKLHIIAYRREVEGIVWNPNYGPHFHAYELRKKP